MSQQTVPNHVRYGLGIGTVFVVWVMLESIFNPVQRHLWADAELLNGVGAWTIPACFVVIVYFVIKHYEKKQKLM